MMVNWQKRVRGLKNTLLIHSHMQTTLCTLKTYQSFIEWFLQNFQVNYYMFLEAVSHTWLEMLLAE